MCSGVPELSSVNPWAAPVVDPGSGTERLVLQVVASRSERPAKQDSWLKHQGASELECRTSQSSVGTHLWLFISGETAQKAVVE